MILVLMVLSLMSGAKAESDPGRDAAVRACGKIASPDKKTDCMQSLKRGAFYDQVSGEFCAKIVNPDRIIDCLDTIVGKQYSAAELEVCGSIVAEAKRIDCLDGAGNKRVNAKSKEAATAPELKDIRTRVRKALNEIRTGKSQDAANMLEILLKDIGENTPAEVKKLDQQPPPVASPESAVE